MESAQNILSVALNHPVMPGRNGTCSAQDPGNSRTVHYVINRYRKVPHATIEDTGMMIYNFKKPGIMKTAASN